jgi:hypothetical protein
MQVPREAAMPPREAAMPSSSSVDLQFDTTNQTQSGHTPSMNIKPEPSHFWPVAFSAAGSLSAEVQRENSGQEISGEYNASEILI